MKKKKLFPDFGLAKVFQEKNSPLTPTAKHTATSNIDSSNSNPNHNHNKAERASHLYLHSSISAEHTAKVGTMTYSSPEQMEGKFYDTKTDIWSVGLILFEMFCLPFETLTEKYIKFSQVKKGILDAKMLASFPEICSLILWLLAKEPSQRPSANGNWVLMKDITLRDFFVL